MKKIILILVSVLFLVSCSGNIPFSEEEKGALKKAKIEISKITKKYWKFFDLVCYKINLIVEIFISCEVQVFISISFKIYSVNASICS